MPSYKFDIAISLLKEDMPFAQALFETFNNYEIKTFLYPHNQKEIANRNGIEVFAKTFKSDARIVVVLYRAGYGDTHYTRIEHAAIQERYLIEGADFCVLIPLDGTRPTWYPAFQIYTSAKMSIQEISELILHKLVDMGGELKRKSFEEHVAEINDIWENKIRHNNYLKSRETFETLKMEMATIKQIFQEKQTFLSAERRLPYSRLSFNGHNNILKNEIGIESIVFSANFIPTEMNIPGGGDSQGRTLCLSIYREIYHPQLTSKVERREVFRYETRKLNIYNGGKIGWSNIVKLNNRLPDNKPHMIDAVEGYNYELDPIIDGTRELLEEWFSNFIKIVFDSHKI